MADMPRGRRPKTPTERAAYRVPSAVLDRLRKFSIADDVTATAALVTALTLYMDMRDAVDLQTWNQAVGRAMTENKSVGQYLASLIGPPKHGR